MVRINLDDAFFADERFNLLASLLNEAEDCSRMRMIRIWRYCYNNKVVSLQPQVIHIQARWTNKSIRLVDCLVESALAEPLPNGEYRIKGMSERITYLTNLKALSERAVEARLRKKIEQLQANLTVTEGSPNGNRKVTIPEEKRGEERRREEKRTQLGGAGGKKKKDPVTTWEPTDEYAKVFENLSAIEKYPFDREHERKVLNSHLERFKLQVKDLENVAYDLRMYSDGNGQKVTRWRGKLNTFVQNYVKRSSGTTPLLQQPTQKKRWHGMVERKVLEDDEEIGA